MSIQIGTLNIKGAPLEGENPLPYFTVPNSDISAEIHGDALEEERFGLGKHTAYCVLPYKLQDRYGRKHRDMCCTSIVMENDNLRATFLPEYGARLYSLYDKKKKRELLFTNPVLQFGNLAIRNAWFSGGIEWNIGQYGHTFGTASPVHAAKFCCADGSEALRFYNFELFSYLHM